MNKFVLVLSLLVSFSVFAHEGHVHEEDVVSIPKAKQIVLKAVKGFTKEDAQLGFGKLDKSWGQLKLSQVNLEQEKNDFYLFKVTSKKNSKSLYILMDIEGDLYDANFTGVFADLK